MLGDPSSIVSALLDLLQGGAHKRERDDPRQGLYVSLARVLAAAAWVDGPMSRVEENQIKSLVSALRPRLTSRETKTLLLDLEGPVPHTLWQELTEQLRQQVKRRSQAGFVVAWVRDLLQIDGSMGEAERDLLSQVELAVRSVAEQVAPTSRADSVAVGGAAAGVASQDAVAPAAMSLGAAAASRTVVERPGDEVLADVVADLRRSEDRQAADLRAVAAPLEKLCVFAAASAFVIGGNAQPRGFVDRNLSTALAALFAVSSSAVDYVLQRAISVIAANNAVTARSSPGDRESVPPPGGAAFAREPAPPAPLHASAFARELAEWGSEVERDVLIAALRGAELRPAARGRLDQLERATRPESRPR